jgi:UDP-glucose 4-epimerase
LLLFFIKKEKEAKIIKILLIKSRNKTTRFVIDFSYIYYSLFYYMQTIIVTGGAGYIGSHTIIELLNNTSYEVVSIDNFSNSTHQTFDRIEEITGKQVRNLNVDICNMEALEYAFTTIKNPVGVIHFAAFKSVGDSVLDPLSYYHNNLGSLVNMLKICKMNNIQSFIFSSSCSVYGNVDKLPVTEDTPFAPAESPYAHTKQIGEEIVLNYSKSDAAFKSVLLRYFNPVGAHESGLNGELSRHRPSNLVPFITQSAAGILPPLTVHGNDYDTRDGSCIRDYIHVSDIADAHVKALNYLIENKQKKQTSTFNLGTGNGVSVLEAITAFEKVTQQKLKYSVGSRRAGDVITIYANNNLSKQELNWNPKYNLDDMMLSAWKWQLHIKDDKNLYI